MTPRNSLFDVARAQPPAIDHDAVEIVDIDLAVEADGAAGGDDTLMQFRQHAARLDMALAGEEQRVAETAIERGFEFGEVFGVQPLVFGRHLGEAFEVGALARMRHHQRAVERRIRQFGAPQIERSQAKPADDRFGDLGFAPRRQHAAGPMAGGIRHRGVTAFM